MAIDTPATIGILGAGPIGLEAALYARFLGYDVVIYERGQVAQHVRAWGHLKMFTPFGQSRSPLGLAALKAQDERYAPPPDDALLTGNEYIQRYLEPLASSDLLSDGVRLGHEVLAAGRENYVKTDSPGDEARSEYDFRLLVRDPAGKEIIEHVDALIDASGVLGNPNWLGGGGMPCPGERELRSKIDYGFPDLLGADRERFAGRCTLVIGEDSCAGLHVATLAALAGTQVTWMSRRGFPESHPASDIPHWPNTDVEALSLDNAGRFQVEVSGEQNGIFTFDRIIAGVGHRPARELTAELQVSLDPITEAATSLLQPEPNLYILGAKSFGRKHEGLRIADGLRQVVEVFKIIGDRETLDLYAGN
jgi:hypothetical protein